ncbi:hypothetical protein COW94_00640 [Candidatus Peregrinibacteria bacterium CG22_combo_CG10-13_8_21_14_all_44_10]|nr:MAG: hypothetical protein AUK45_00745 [Candidatus Peregrinibacteria bacterium CG2_30_44_17]PIP66654.1 MAG: hypothetical protein COW94_00640 [Candidatus Peregrinibacteria bacterium CG22_combo_CG10-13_8_21_14_all_44_10]PIX79533.1 MAG: hypothetical protein COZ35_03240 [Candidatus Peregrinibacteria bacterium CG_4_10_14_3_um_filter_44_21]PJB88541.1 MAG: hypothetical protein CO082_04040 [Candidatus Peregrinibacteria bacterium CG_4_9_14_0_8_um_filter_44_15]
MTEDNIIENFWAQLMELQRSQPRLGLGTLVNENSRYTNFTDRCKNCYLLTNAWNNEDCMHGRSISFSKDCVDCEKVTKSTLCYECIDCINCYNCNSLQECEDCTDCTLGYDLKGCKNCYGCVGLRHKENCIFNKPVPPNESISRQQAIEIFEELKTKTPRLYANNQNVENVTGDLLRNSKNLQNCFIMEGCQDCSHCLECVEVTDTLDTEFCEYGGFNYECLSAWKLRSSNYCSFCWESSDLEYCEHVFRSNHCFGCVFLNHKEYHILNQPCSREEYFRLKNRILDKLKADGAYGKKFLPSIYPYEDTIANDVWSK